MKSKDVVMLISKKKINEFFIVILVIICVIFPADILSLKKITFLILCIYNYKLLLVCFLKRENLILTSFGLLFPAYLITYSLVLTGDFSLSFSRTFVGFFFLLIFIIREYEINIQKIIVNSIKITIIITLFLLIFDVFRIIDINGNNLFREYIYKFDIGVIGKSPNYPFYYKIFLKTIPLAVIVFFSSYEKKKYLWFIMAFIALVISGTRANIAFSIIGLSLYVINERKRKNNSIYYSILILGAFSIVVFFPYVLNVINDLFISKGQASDIVRMGHLKGIKELVKESPLILLTGSGMGSGFYTYAYNEIRSSVEWSYLDLWRQMGIFFFVMFLFFILTPFFHKKKLDRYKIYAYGTYLMIAGTNPLLFNSTAYLFYIFVYFDLSKKQITV